MTTFALIHGAWGSGWHWASVPAELRSMGHEVVAPDLPCEDPHATFDDYAEVVLGALSETRDDDLVVVGYSLGGHTAALVAARRPVRELVYVAAMLPEPGLSLNDQFRRGDRMLLPEYASGIEGARVGRAQPLGRFRRLPPDRVSRLPGASRAREIRTQPWPVHSPLRASVSADAVAEGARALPALQRRPSHEQPVLAPRRAHPARDRADRAPRQPLADGLPAGGAGAASGRPRTRTPARSLTAVASSASPRTR